MSGIVDLLHKLSSILPRKMYVLIKSYFINRRFYIQQENAYLELKNIGAGVPQGSMLGPVLYLLNVNDVHENCQYNKVPWLNT